MHARYTTFLFDSVAERDAFIVGVEFVNDSAVEIAETETGPDGSFSVTIEDEDQTRGRNTRNCRK